MLTTEAIEQLQLSLNAALEIELPRLHEVRAACGLGLERQPIPEQAASLHSIATVATDGGENQLRLDPIRVHVLRIADSDGNRHFDGFIPMSLLPIEILEKHFLKDPLIRFLQSELNLTLESMLPSTSYQKGNFLQMLRELLEWAALLRLASERKGPRLLIRDGLLRSVVVPDHIWEPLAQRFEHHTKANGHLLVGVAKQSAVLNYLSLAMALEQSLPPGTAGYVSVPRDLEKDAAPPAYNWMGARSLGELCALRTTNATGLIFACEVPRWLQHATGTIMANLARNAGAFPYAGYPVALADAHQYARLGQFEIAFMEQLLLRALAEHDQALALQVSLQQTLGRRLSLPVGDHDA